jgi:hypothetical protein
MMPNIKITMKDGTVRDFPHEGRAGGGYTKTVKYQGGFVIVTDEWDAKTAFPATDVAEVKETPERGRW